MARISRLSPKKVPTKAAAIKTDSNGILNALLLVVPALWVLLPRVAYRPVAYGSWLVLIYLTKGVALESIVLPPLLAGVITTTHHSTVTLNLALALATSTPGAIAATAWVWYVDRSLILSPLALFVVMNTILYVAPRSFPVSEAALLGIGILDVTLLSLDTPADWPKLLFSGAVAVLPCYPLLYIHARDFRKSRGKSINSLLVALVYAVYFGTAGSIYFGYFGQSPSWVLGLLQQNVDLIAYWTLVLTVAGAVAWLIGNKLTLDTRRKLWHLTAVALFLPSAHRPFTATALAVALVLFAVLETARATALPPLGLHIHAMLKNFMDPRDTCGPVVVSHIYLLIGIAGPIFASGSPAGILGLGVGDTFASQVGKRFGNVRICGDKTLEGTVAFAVSVSVVLHFFMGYAWLRAVLVGSLSALFEAVCSFNDNLAVPLYTLFLCTV